MERAQTEREHSRLGSCRKTFLNKSLYGTWVESWRYLVGKHMGWPVNNTFTTPITTTCTLRIPIIYPTNDAPCFFDISVYCSQSKSLISRNSWTLLTGKSLWIYVPLVCVCCELNLFPLSSQQGCQEFEDQEEFHWNQVQDPLLQVPLHLEGHWQGKGCQVKERFTSHLDQEGN